VCGLVKVIDKPFVYGMGKKGDCHALRRHSEERRIALTWESHRVLRYELKRRLPRGLHPSQWQNGGQWQRGVSWWLH